MCPPSRVAGLGRAAAPTAWRRMRPQLHAASATFAHTPVWNSTSDSNSSGETFSANSPLPRGQDASARGTRSNVSGSRSMYSSSTPTVYGGPAPKRCSTTLAAAAGSDINGTIRTVANASIPRPPVGARRETTRAAATSARDGDEIRQRALHGTPGPSWTNTGTLDLALNVATPVASSAAKLRDPTGARRACELRLPHHRQGQGQGEVSVGGHLHYAVSAGRALPRRPCTPQSDG